MADLLTAAGLAFAGGMLLNLMPCVLPVLSLKVMQIADVRRHRLAHAFVYAAGIIVSFLILFAILLILKSTGRSVGWGFQLQSPVFVALMCAFFLIFALNLMGVFEIPGINRLASITGTVSDSAIGHKEPGMFDAFVAGVLAVLVASPCSAPFMGAALGYGVTSGITAGLVVFTMLGIGLAFPFVLLAAIPGLALKLPKPGPWMNSFRNLLGMLMLATVLWLVWIFSGMVDRQSFAVLIASLWLLAGALWIAGTAKGILRFIGALIFILSLGFVSYSGAASTALSALKVESGEWKNFSLELLDASKMSQPVFIDFTADWCLSCKVNERVVFSRDDIKAEFKKRNVVLLRADWTREDAEVTHALAMFDRNSVPLYVLYPGPGKAPVVLPSVLTPSIVMDELVKITN